MDCIFCKIANGDIPCAKIWENDKFLAFLDLNPNTKGMALVITKQHYDSYAFDMPDNIYSELLIASKKVAKMLEKGLEVNRVGMIMEGMGVNHVHIKLYPMYGVDKEFNECVSSVRVLIDDYPGYLTTQMGPQKSLDELKALAKEIKDKI